MARETKLDRRDLPRYTPQEAAHHLALPVSTVRAWSVGQRGRQRDKVRFFQPLISPAQKTPLSLSFWNLVELYVLRSLRRTHDFPMPSDGQTVMRSVLVDSLRRVERGTDGRVVRFYPWLNESTEVRAVEIDPDRAFGRLVLVGTGIPTQAIAERFAEGDDIDVLARDFELDVAKIQQALRWEQRKARAA
jgi:uncharacterized protein (DUF433 family)